MISIITVWAFFAFCLWLACSPQRCPPTDFGRMFPFLAFGLMTGGCSALWPHIESMRAMFWLNDLSGLTPLHHLVLVMTLMVTTVGPLALIVTRALSEKSAEMPDSSTKPTICRNWNERY